MQMAETVVNKPTVSVNVETFFSNQVATPHNKNYIKTAYLEKSDNWLFPIENRSVLYFY